MKYKVGFTGTSKGMTPGQKKEIASALGPIAHKVVGHHGDCVGADSEFHDICLELGIPVVIHPPKNPKSRAYCKGAKQVHSEYDYLTRNHHIVDNAMLLIAAPKSQEEELRSGTWATVRYARKQNVSIYMVTP